MAEIIEAGSIELDKDTPKIVDAGSIELDKPAQASGPTIQSWKGPTFMDKAWSLFDNPDKEQAKAVQALVDGEALGISPSAAYRYRDQIDEGVKINPQAAMKRSTLTQRVKQSFDTGVKQNQIGEIGYQYIMTGDPKHLEAMSKITVPGESDTYISEGKVETAIRSAAKMFPMMADVASESVGTGFTMGMAFGGTAAILGQMGPQAALPEEVVTVPAATLTGFTIGATAKAFESSLRKEAGLALSEIINLKDEGGRQIDPGIARAASFGIGAINGAIEVAQIGKLLKTVPGLDKLFSRAVLETVASKTVKDKLTGLAMLYTKTVATETGQEVAQESTNIIFEELGKKVNNAVKGTDIKQSTMDDILSRLQATAIESAQGFSVMAAPGSIVKAGMAVMPQRQEKASPQPAQAIPSAPQISVNAPGLSGIATIESGGDYTAENKQTKAYGKYQIMPSNWGAWAKEAGLSEDAPQTPENQEKVASYKWNQYMERFGSEELVATAWFAGPGAAQRLMNGDTTILSRADVTGTTVEEYIAKTTGREFGMEVAGQSAANIDDVITRAIETDESIDDIADSFFEGVVTDEEQMQGEEGLAWAEGQTVEETGPSIIEQVKTINDAIGEKGSVDLTPVVNLGRSIYQSGATTFEKFSAKIQELVGDAWDKVKDLVRQAWDVISNESGKITIEKGKKSGKIKDASQQTPSQTLAEPDRSVQGKSEAELSSAYNQAETQATTELKSLLAKAEKALASAQKRNKPTAIRKAQEKVQSVKARIREATGQTKGPKVITEMDALKAAMKKAEQASRAAFKAGNKAALREAVSNIKTIKQQIADFVGQRKSDDKTVTEYDALKASFIKAAQAARVAYREGNKAGVEKAREGMTQALTRLEWMKRRRERIKMARDYFGLTDADLKSISKKNPLLMDDRQFNRYMQGIEEKAQELAETKQARLEVTGLIAERRLKKVDNYIKALELPPISQMTTEQLNELFDLLEPFQDDDVFLTKRELETIDRTDLSGMRTWREVTEALAKEIGVPVDDLANVHPSWRDNFRWDTSLREQNPFYDFLVTSMTTEILNSEVRYHEIETRAYELAKASEKSRDRSMAEKAIPQDRQIMDYLEADDETKASITESMTTEQVEYATFIQDYFSRALEYLIATKALEKGRENYFVHIRRSFLENAKDEGIISAFKNLFKNYHQDEAVFNILDDNTGNILPLEKFFQFALMRTGELVPTANVTRAFLTYARTFEKKVSLDKIIPKIQIYTQALTPAQYTPRGLEYDTSLKRFVNKWVNNKKGRKISYDGVIKQGGAIDLGITGLRTFITLLDLGLNIPVGIASFVGEQVASMEMLGTKNYTKSTAMMQTKKGKAIIEKYRAFVGRSFWEDFNAPGRELPARFADLAFGLFHMSNVTANKQFLLGSLTEKEWNSGEISSERLAEIKLEMGRFRVVPGTGSLVGSTSLGDAATQYKKWAVPIMRTLATDAKALVKDLKNKGAGEALTSREAKELYRFVGLSSAVLITGAIMVGDDDDRDNSMIGKLKSRVYREALTLMQGVDPKLWLATPRMLVWLGKLGNNLHSLLVLETYKTKPGLKGAKGLKEQFSPSMIRGSGRDQSDRRNR